MSDNINIQKTSLAWLDDSTNDSQDNVVAEQQLRLLESDLKMFKTINECEEYVKSESADTRITLIVNGRLGEQIVPVIDSLPQVVDIYVYCMKKEVHEKWAVNFNKVFV